jgi:hypothetical protein
LFRTLDSVGKLCVAAVINVAVELTIARNRIQGLHSVGSAGQTISVIIAAGAVLRVVYVFWFGEDGDPLEDEFGGTDVPKGLHFLRYWGETARTRLPLGAAPEEFRYQGKTAPIGESEVGSTGNTVE